MAGKTESQLETGQGTARLPANVSHARPLM